MHITFKQQMYLHHHNLSNAPNTTTMYYTAKYNLAELLI